MTAVDIPEFLRQVYVFSALGADERATIAERFRVVPVAAGEVIFREGDPGGELYIVERGRVATFINVPGGAQKEIAAFAPGDFFGEMSIFEKAPRSATCIATEESVLVSLSQEEFMSLVDPYPEIATRIMHRMLAITTQRLRTTGEFLSEIVRWGEGASKRAITDEVTGVYNRRFLEEAIVSHYDTSVGTGRPLSIIMMDLDNFRGINERFGIEAADRAFREVADAISRRLGDADILARYGGDEFTALLPGTPLEGAARIAERIRVDVEALDVLTGLTDARTCLTLSQGVVAYPESARTLKSLREKADAALYRAKENGRNRVERG